ncbi:MAG: hypothetical protein NVS1B13_19130 [Flavisolibacter sp.]
MFINTPFFQLCTVKKRPKRIYFVNENLLVRIGVKIRETRSIRNLSQEMLANECEIDYSQINRMELGKVNFSISYLYKIAGALGVNPKDLLP